MTRSSSHARAASGDDAASSSSARGDDANAATTSTSSAARLRVGKGALGAALGVAAFCAPYVAPAHISTTSTCSTSTSTSTSTSASHGCFTARVAHAAEATAETPSSSSAAADLLPGPPTAGSHYPTTTVRELTPRLRDFLGWLDGVAVECATRGVSQKTIDAVGLHKLNAVDPPPPLTVWPYCTPPCIAWKKRLVSTLEAYEVKNWFQAFAFKCNLYRYTVG